MTTINTNPAQNYLDIQNRIKVDSQKSTFDLEHTYANPINFSGTTNVQQTNGTTTGSEKPEEPEKNDGEIGFWKASWNVLKGVGKFFWGMVADENGDLSLSQIGKTLITGAAIAAASILIPGAGTALAIGFLGLGAYHTTKAAVDIYNAKTDAEDELAWQSLGSGLTETALAAIACKKTGAFEKVGKAYEATKGKVLDLKSAYDNGGLEGLKTEAGFQIQDARTAIRTDIIEPTKANWKSMTDKSARFNNAERSYQDRIRKATPEEATKITEEYNAYKNGYNKVATETDYSRAADTVEALKENLKTAREAANQRGASDAAKLDYRKAQAEYRAAKTTLDTRVNAGEFKTSIAKDILDNDVKIAKDNLKAAREALDGTDATRISYENAQKAYRRAVNTRTASIGETGRTFRLKAAIRDGVRTDGFGWLTTTAAGRGYQVA